ncbi:MAG: polysaccharide deacetylase family protein [Bdellovibrionota bacterium]
MKKILKQLVLNVLYVLHPILPDRKGIAILMYHAVDSSGWEFSITPEMFERQMRYLRDNKYTFLSLGQVVDMTDGKLPIPAKAVVVTFDDGYMSVATDAAPIAERYAIPVVLFIHTDQSQKELGNNLSLLDWEEIKKLRQEGFTIESHSHTHPNLKKLSREQIETDLKAVEETFLQNIGNKPKFFAYPGGKYSIEAVGSLRSSGYRGAFTINRGRVMVGDDPFQLKRNGMGRDTSWIEFLVRVSPANDLYERIVNFIK